MSTKEPDTRERILLATVELLEQHGSQGARMSDIAKAAGISRQAVYLHFASRTDLLVATTKYLDEVLDIDRRLAPSRAAKSGVDRLALYIEGWGNYIPEIYGVANALLRVQDTDEAAATAWQDRMLAMRAGCRAAIAALHSDGMLAPEWTPKKATDALWTMLLVPNWENLTRQCGWSTKQYVRWIRIIAERTFVRQV